MLCCTYSNISLIHIFDQFPRILIKRLLSRMDEILNFFGFPPPNSNILFVKHLILFEGCDCYVFFFSLFTQYHKHETCLLCSKSYISHHAMFVYWNANHLHKNKISVYMAPYNKWSSSHGRDSHTDSSLTKILFFSRR